MAVVREPRSAHEDMKSIIQQSPAISFSMGWDKITQQSKAFLRDSDNGFFPVKHYSYQMMPPAAAP